MRVTRSVLGLTVAALALSACGTATAGPAAPPTASRVQTTSTAAPGSAPTSAPPDAQPGDSRGPVFPITLRRTGGIADFDDTVVLEASGRVLVETRTVHGRVCVLTEQRRDPLYGVLGTLRHGEDERPGDSSTSADGNDVIRIRLTDAHGHPFDLTDPSLGSVSDLVGTLVSDVTLSSPATVACHTQDS